MNWKIKTFYKCCNKFYLVQVFIKDPILIGAAILSNVAYNIIYPVCPSIFLKQHSLKSPLLSLRSPPPIYMIQLCIHTFSGVAIGLQGVAF